MENGDKSVTVAWENDEQTILRFDFARRWTWPDINIAMRCANTMIEALSHQKPLGTLIVPTSLYLAPNTLSEAKRELLHRHPRIVLIALVTDNMLFRNMGNAFVRLVPPMQGVYFIVPSLNAAHDLMQQLPHRFDGANITAS